MEPQRLPVTTEAAPIERRAVSAITPMEMLQMAVQQNADLDKLTKLMDLQERWQVNEARKAFVAAMNGFKANPPTLTKDREIKHDKKLIGKYAGLDQVARVIGQALSEHGLSFRWETSQPGGGAICVTCILTHEQGHGESVGLSGMPDTSGAKNSIQAIGSTVTYLQRYTLLAITGLAAEDQDDDGNGGGSGEFITADQKAALIDLMRATDSDTVKFLAFLGVDTLDQLPAKRFNEAKVALERKKQKA